MYDVTTEISNLLSAIKFYKQLCGDEMYSKKELGDKFIKS